MNSIYETIMGLPLFKGASIESIHTFVEKTPLSFSKYDAGSAIVTPSTHCDSLKCLLSGRVRIAFRAYDDSVEISYTSGPEIVLGMEHLFGLETSYGCRVTAETSCGVMEFSKRNFVHLLRDNHLMLINYLNHLSMLAQRGPKVVGTQGCGNPLDMMRMAVAILTRRNASHIVVKSRNGALAALAGNPEQFKTELSSLAECGVVRVVSSQEFEVLSAERFLNAE